LWAAKNDKSKHVFNYQEMRKVTGKQMKTVWRKNEFEQPSDQATKEENENPGSFVPSLLNPIWTLSAPASAEKEHGKHPTQKPVALVERCLLASTNEGDLVLDPFLGNGTAALARPSSRPLTPTPSPASWKNSIPTTGMCVIKSASSFRCYATPVYYCTSSAASGACRNHPPRIQLRSEPG
jgi:hypothetical protein